MAVLLGLLAALAYGSSDFAAGLASRRLSAGPVSIVTQTLGLLTTAGAVLIFPGAGPSTTTLAWGAVSGIGSALGTLSLYHGLAIARMSVVAPIAAVLTAAVPVLVGVALGNHLSTVSIAGIVLAIPAIALVSRQPPRYDSLRARAGVIYGTLAGLGFALLFIALDQAGTRNGAWPLLPGQAISLLLIAPFAYRGLQTTDRPHLDTAALTVTAGVTSATANLLFLAATGHGQLSIVAVLTALYPAVTVLLARALLSERWTRPQVTGLLLSAAAIALITIA
jgi:drug/metabolite transporter (DMT)-like permease